MKRMRLIAVLTACMAAAIAPAAQAEIVLSKVIMDFVEPDQSYDDIEVFNSGEDRVFVAVEPFEIRNPGTPGEERVAITDPESAGIIVSPRRLILEPGERRVVRATVLGAPPAQDRVYRVTMKPVVGPVTADASALKVLVGYDALVIRRPAGIHGKVKAVRAGNRLSITNGTNTAREFYHGVQCDRSGDNCVSLPAARLYAGASWELDLPYDTPATFKTAWGGQSGEVSF